MEMAVQTRAAIHGVAMNIELRNPEGRRVTYVLAVPTLEGQ